MLLDMYDLAVRITLESVNVTWTMKVAGNRTFVITLRLSLCWLAKTQYFFFGHNRVSAYSFDNMNYLIMELLSCGNQIRLFVRLTELGIFYCRNLVF